jgi:hypothetical protein
MTRDTIPTDNLRVIETIDKAPIFDQRFKLTAFNDVKLSTTANYLVKGIVPREGLIVVWGPPKCGKSFWTFDLSMHVALNWQYRDCKVQQGGVVYLALEGRGGFAARIEAWKQFHQLDGSDVPFHLLGVPVDLIADHQKLIAAIKAQIETPALIAIDTLNRSLNGSENDPKDMAAYVRAADALREKFAAAVVIVHHCGIEGTRPRGHTSLSGAADAQIAVSQNDETGLITATVELMKDAAADVAIYSRLEIVQVGTDDEGDSINSCVIVVTDQKAPTSEPQGPRLPKTQHTMFTILHDAGPHGLTTSEWDDQGRTAAGIGVKRRADLYDARSALKAKGLVRQFGDRWIINSSN